MSNQLDRILFRIFFFFHSVGVILLVLDILPLFNFSGWFILTFIIHTVVYILNNSHLPMEKNIQRLLDRANGVALWNDGHHVYVDRNDGGSMACLHCDRNSRSGASIRLQPFKESRYE